jgi:hypothetical protein
MQLFAGIGFGGRENVGWGGSWSVAEKVRVLGLFVWVRCWLQPFQGDAGDGLPNSERANRFLFLYRCRKSCV